MINVSRETIPNIGGNNVSRETFCLWEGRKVTYTVEVYSTGLVVRCALDYLP